MKTLHQLLKGSYPRIEETIISLLNVIGDGVRIIDTNFKIIYPRLSIRKILLMAAIRGYEA
jgi:hypothetical protein